MVAALRRSRGSKTRYRGLLAKVAARGFAKAAGVKLTSNPDASLANYRAVGSKGL